MTEAERYITIDGLHGFTHGWCLDRAKTDESGELTFRCSGCPFVDGANCKIKRFVHNQFGAEAAYSISAMSR